MSSSAGKGGMGFVSTLTLIFVVLKILKLIDWSWLWVLSPVWGSGGLVLIVFGAIMVAGRLKKGKW